VENRPTVYFTPGSAQDPQELDFQARTYGWEVKVTPMPIPQHRSPWGTGAQALGLIVFCLGLLLAKATANPLETTTSTFGTGKVTSQVEFVDYSATANSGAGGWKVKITQSYSGTEPVNAAGASRVYLANGTTIFQYSGVSQNGSHAAVATSTNYVPLSTVIYHGVWVDYNGVYYANTETITTPGAESNVKKVRISYFNSRSIPVIIHVVDAANPSTNIATATVPAGTGFIQTITLPTGVDAATVYEEIPDYTKDGVTWVAIAGASTNLSGVTVTGSTVAPTADPDTTSVPQTPNLPDAPSNPDNNPNPPADTTPVAPRAPTPWSPRTDQPPPVPGSTSDFTIVAYREGIDKLSKILEGDTVNVPNAPSTPVSAIGATNINDANTKSLAKLPSAPTIGTMTTVGTVSYTLVFPKIHGETLTTKTINIDFTQPPYATPIAVVRAALLVILTLTYFLVTFYTVRSAFTGK